jgi:hypothetical protein
MADTGASQVIYEDNDCLGAEFIRQIRDVSYGPGGDTGTTADFPFVAVSGRLRVKVTAGSTCAGALFVWTEE